MLAPNAQACDWLPPSGMVSEWLDDKTVFWGRPIKTEWHADSGGVTSVINVIKPLKGNVSGDLQVDHAYHTSCEVFYELGRIQLFVLPETEEKFYRTGQYIEDFVSKPAIFAYFEDDLDLPVSEHSAAIASFDLEKECKKLQQASSENGNSERCKRHVFVKDLRSAYRAKQEELEKKSRP